MSQIRSNLKSKPHPKSPKGWVKDTKRTECVMEIIDWSIDEITIC